METETLEADVMQARGGDQAAFGRIVAATANTVCSISLAIVRNVQASEDVAQETFVAAWQGLRQLRDPASFLPWLRQVTRHKAHLWRRAHRREVDDEGVLDSAVDFRMRPDAALIAAEEREVLASVLDELSDEAREVLVLYYREGSSTRQVAALLGISDDAVRQRLSRSRALLREEVLQRFGGVVNRTAPGAAFLAALLAVLPAPAAAAVVVASSAGSAVSAATIAKASLIGAVLSWIGVLVGMRLLGRPFDEQEAHQLSRFRNQMLILVTIGSLVVAISAQSLFVMAFTIQALYAAIAYAYIVKLPRILQRRRQGRTGPHDSGKQDGTWMRAAIGGALTAAISGTMLMATLILATRLIPG